MILFGVCIVLVGVILCVVDEDGFFLGELIFLEGVLVLMVDWSGGVYVFVGVLFVEGSFWFLIY